MRAGWQKARAMLTQGEYRPRIALELKSPKRVTLSQDRGEFHPRGRKEVELKPSKWVKGKFIEGNRCECAALVPGTRDQLYAGRSQQDSTGAPQVGP